MSKRDKSVRHERAVWVCDPRWGSEPWEIAPEPGEMLLN
jgi:hypothetical protein